MGKITSDKNIPFGTQPYSFNHPNIPCFTKLDVQEAFRKKIHMICDKRRTSNQNIEILKILAPLTLNHNAPNKYGWTSIRFYDILFKMTKYPSMMDNPDVQNKIEKPPWTGAWTIDNPNIPNIDKKGRRDIQ